MIKRTLYFSNPARLRVKDNQLLIIREEQQDVSVPIEDLGFIVLDHYSITISHQTLAELLNHNVAIITTNKKHMPAGLMLPMAGNIEQGESLRAQINASIPLKKRLWQQTVRAKIKNQANLLDRIGCKEHALRSMINQVLSDDSTNQEAAAAKMYWQLLFNPEKFHRHREGQPPNNLLNYGYAILRSVIAKALCGTGLLPQLGIHHCNRYDPFPLADDIMEPYRPFIDEIVLQIFHDGEDVSELNPELKKRLLEIPAIGVMMKGEVKPLHLAAARTAASLKRCFEEEDKNIIYPVL